MKNKTRAPAFISLYLIFGALKMPSQALMSKSPVGSYLECHLAETMLQIANICILKTFQAVFEHKVA